MAKSTMVDITMTVIIDEDNLPKLQRLTHHIEELVDLESWPEIIGVGGVKVKKVWV